MKKSLKIIMIIIIIAIVIYVISVILNSLIIGGLFHPPIEKDEMKKLFYEDYEDLEDIANFLATIEYKNIYISNTTESEMISASGENIVIKDEQVMHSINTLISRGYDVITKDNNTVSFQRWSNLDAGRGIAFSIDGTQPNLQFLTKLEKINGSNWYYYEEDYSIWQNNNTTNGFPNYLLGEWDLQYAKTRGAGETDKEYPLDRLYSEEILDNGVKMFFNSDGTFFRTVGNPLMESTTKGTYILRYENKILLKHENGTQSTVQYLVKTGEIVYYTVDDNLNAIDEYYVRQ